MDFRIRDLSSDDASRSELADIAYREHLAAIDKSRDLDLWKYFYWDFFHDGWIRSISVSACAPQTWVARSTARFTA